MSLQLMRGPGWSAVQHHHHAALLGGTLRCELADRAGQSPVHLLPVPRVHGVISGKSFQCSASSFPRLWLESNGIICC